MTGGGRRTRRCWRTRWPTRPSTGSVPWATRWRAGPVEALVSVATETGAELIVVGNRGLHGPGGSLDSVAGRVALVAPCHLMVAKTT